MHDPSDTAGLASVSDLPPLKITERSTQLVLSSPYATSKQIIIQKAVLDLTKVRAPLAIINAAQINKVNKNFNSAKNNSISTECQVTDCMRPREAVCDRACVSAPQHTFIKGP